ncbi:MAG: tRNA adenosine(34) deaminase TadA [candidate division KSB1 bacterium]|nr:tRNA adenosine(34) deaminase TadA [candidate division KSB1 bacterium]
MTEHERWMQEALVEARKALEKGEVPVGAVVVYEERIVGRGHNLVETILDPTAHAEMLAITAAAGALADWRLKDCSLYVTLEPCPMCAGAVVLSRMRRVVFGARDPRWGACGSAYHILNAANPEVRVELIPGVCEAEASSLLREFFAKLRAEG